MKRKYKILIIISVVAVILDQLTKWWAKGLRGRPAITVIDNFFHFVYVENRGAAWGMFSNLPDGVRVPFFLMISCVAVAFIFYFLRRVEDRQIGLIIALSCILGGAIGNFIDRIAYTSVIDFIDWHYYTHHWPTFNVADVFISVGVALMLFEMLFGTGELSLFRREETSKAKALDTPPNDTPAG